MHRGAAGAGVLNTLLQEALTPGRPDVPERRFGGASSAWATKSPRSATTTTKAPTGCSTPPKGLSQLTHAYAMSIHRSQGSEYPCVVLPITTSAWMMLQRNLLYTAVTRAKKLVVLVGSKKAIGQAVRTVGAGRRHTTLDYRLSHQ